MAKINSLTAKIADGNNPLFHELYGVNEVVLKEQAVRYADLMNDGQRTPRCDTAVLRTCSFELRCEQLTGIARAARKLPHVLKHVKVGHRSVSAKS